MIAPYKPPAESGFAPARVWIYPMPADVKARVEADPLHFHDPEAHTLWDRKPKYHQKCQRCGDRAEPFEFRNEFGRHAAYCWLCCKKLENGIGVD